MVVGGAVRIGPPSKGGAPAMTPAPPGHVAQGSQQSAGMAPRWRQRLNQPPPSPGQLLPQLAQPAAVNKLAASVKDATRLTIATFLLCSLSQASSGKDLLAAIMRQDANLSKPAANESDLFSPRR
jgi:hypothetical protein